MVQEVIYFLFDNLVNVCSFFVAGNAFMWEEIQKVQKKKVLPGTEINAGDIKMNKIQLLPSRWKSI